MYKLISLLSLSFLFSFSSFSSAHDLMAAIESEDRSPKNVVRDEFRNPAETLTFFQIKPDMKVVELSPGGGWYTEILANYLHEPGMLIAAHFDKDSEVGYFKRGRANFEKKIASSPMYSNVEIVDLSSNLAEENSVDAVITFRNLHNWLGPQMDSIFANSFKALKPGGVFGVVEHRAYAGTSIDESLKITADQYNDEIIVDILYSLRDEIIQGKRLGQAMRKYPQVFSNTYVSLVTAGDTSGNLDVVFENIADSLE